MEIPWNGIALCTAAVLGGVLVLRLFQLKLHRVYGVLCAYLIFGVISSWIALAEASSFVKLDYRVTYLVVAAVCWVLTLWMVHALLGAILARLTGILGFSRRLLAGVFVVGAVLAIVTVMSEMKADQVSDRGWTLIVALSQSLERVITTIALLALLAIQAFILWFPVSLPRNLVLFSIGFVFNFVCETALLAIRRLVSPAAATAVIDPVNLFVLSACLGYFSIVITKAGETIPMRLGHSWRRSEQDRLMEQLNQLNGSLLRSVRKLNERSPL